jgi:hypothetical protein
MKVKACSPRMGEHFHDMFHDFTEKFTEQKVKTDRWYFWTPIQNLYSFGTSWYKLHMSESAEEH